MAQILSPRDYQLELFQRAREQNTIAVLDTGSGKTFIACLLLRWAIESELKRLEGVNLHDQGGDRKLSFFLVTTVNLVFQQHAALESNLDYRVARLCGADGTDHWRGDAWEKLFSDHHAVVCTADILLHCLSKGFISMKRINLIVFDEAHHAKKKHAYALIIRTFYTLEADAANRPRIFGMTASPVDAKGNVMEQAFDLETLLHCKIATAPEASLALAIHKPQEKRLLYPRSVHTQTPFLLKIKENYGCVPTFTAPLQRAFLIAQSLGPWFAETFFLQNLSDDRQIRHELGLQKHFRMRDEQIEYEGLDRAVEEMHNAVAWAQQHVPRLAAPTEVSPKVQALDKYLREHYARPTTHRCIVFVEQRATARLLHAYFRAIKDNHPHHLNTDYLVGTGATNEDDFTSTLRKQMITLLNFREGKVNCLFATQVAEEGLDIAECNLVVRFDLPRSMIQYVQSRGRARSKDSSYVHMMEAENFQHTRLVEEMKEQEFAMKQFCRVLPQDRYLTGDEGAVGTFLHLGSKLPSYVEPSTGATLTYGTAQGFLETFVSLLPTKSLDPQHPNYAVSSTLEGFVAEVLLPADAPFTFFIGDPHAKKILAKQSAAFKACTKLRQHGFLNENFQSTLRKELPAMRNALLAVSSKKRAQYENRFKPNVWSKGHGTIPSELWMTLLDFSEDIDQPYRPLILLTRTQMPQFPNFPVFLNNGLERSIVSTSFDVPLAVTRESMDKFAAFTFRIFQDVFSKKYESDASKLSYWICPASHRPLEARPSRRIDWDILDEVCAHEEYKWTPDTPNDFLLNKFLVDIWDGSRKFYSRSINTVLKQTDPPPDDVVKYQWNDTILDYTVSLWRRARALRTWTPNQPVIEAEQLLTRRNLLAAPVPSEVDRTSRAVLCPEPLRISALPTFVVSSTVVLPAIIHRFESYLIALEGCEIIGLQVEPALALEAFTKDSDDSGTEESDEPPKLHHGLGNNYERLEFIGDTILKMATTIATFVNNPDSNEYEFHISRMLMLCNKNLHRVALDLNLFEFIRCTAFSRRTWYPQGIILLEGKGAKRSENNDDAAHLATNTMQPLSDKTIADVSEALIGAAFVTYDRPDDWHHELWDTVVHTVTKLVDSEDHRMRTWDDYSKAYGLPAYQIAPANVVQRYLAENVQSEFNYRFRYPRLLYSAFLHPSTTFHVEGVPNYQRLEFLGDALLDTVAVSFLYYQYPEADPQWLTEHKMDIVSNRFLGAVCALIGFHKHIRFTDPTIRAAITTYTVDLFEARRIEGPSDRNFWTTVSNPPKCLADVVEAFIAAMFIDSDFDFSQVQRFFNMHIRPFFEPVEEYKGDESS